jgi:hypothetical protein
MGERVPSKSKNHKVRLVPARFLITPLTSDLVGLMRAAKALARAGGAPCRLPFAVRVEKGGDGAGDPSLRSRSATEGEEAPERTRGRGVAKKMARPSLSRDRAMPFAHRATVRFVPVVSSAATANPGSLLARGAARNSAIGFSLPRRRPHSHRGKPVFSPRIASRPRTAPGA